MSHPNSTDRILLVEDDKKTAGLISMYLEKDGFKTWVAHDGEQALALAKRYNPTFVILDLMLPKIDGWEVCRRLRSSSDVPILILTARDQEMERVLGLSLGADDYVVKPFQPEGASRKGKGYPPTNRTGAVEEQETPCAQGANSRSRKVQSHLEWTPDFADSFRV